MILVDTSVLIDFFKGNNTAGVQKLSNLLENNLKLLHNDKDFENIKKAIPALEFY